MLKIIVLLLTGLMLLGCDNDGSNDNSGIRISDSELDYCDHDNIEVCGEIGKLDCGYTVDGPMYYFNVATEGIIYECSGWGKCYDADFKEIEDCTLVCPPTQWDC